MKLKKDNVKDVLMIQSAIFMMSFSGVFYKIAKQYQFVKNKFIFFYFSKITILSVYAIVLQQILRKVDLTVAFSNRALSVVWSMIWGVLLFHEVITFRMFFGAIIIMIGILLVVTSHE